MAGLQIVEARSPEEVAEVGRFFRAYAEWMEAHVGVSLCFQNFDQEMARFPAIYWGAAEGPRDGALLLGRGSDGVALGAVGMWRLEAGVAEMKRMFVSAPARGTGAGRALALALIARARELGYREMRLDTLPALQAARALYERLGFTPMENYNANPMPGALHFRLDLGAPANNDREAAQ